MSIKSLGPVVGAWYSDLQTGATFEVVAWDPQSLTVETQHIDGEVSEYDLDSWRQFVTGQHASLVAYFSDRAGFSELDRVFVDLQLEREHDSAKFERRPSGRSTIVNGCKTKR